VLGARSVEMRACLSPEVEKVLEPRGRDESGPRAAPLEERVRGDRRPVGEAIDTVDPECDGRGGDRLLLPSRRGHLRRAHLSARDEDGVRERPADVDPKRPHGGIVALERLV